MIKLHFKPDLIHILDLEGKVDFEEEEYWLFIWMTL
jgi:hypothetical protein